ncbi:MAG: hypothetical protein WCD13_11570, partial [Pseudolabrys sp.]
SGLVSRQPCWISMGRKYPCEENRPQNHRAILDMDQASCTDQPWGYFFWIEMIKLMLDAEAS